MVSQEEKNTNKLWVKGFLTLANIRDIILLIFLTTVTWKLINSNISISLQSFSFTDLLSVLLAFFAIALSAAFYFKASDTSSKFYDNSYKFTKEVSEILGRIESGFGEKLQHIDDGYVGLREKFDKMPFDVTQAKEKEKQEEQHIQEAEDERDKIINDLMKKAKIAGKEKDSLLNQLKTNSSELEHSKAQLRDLQEKISNEEHKTPRVSEGFISHLASNARANHLSLPTKEPHVTFNALLKSNVIGSDEFTYMENKKLIENNKLTEQGKRMMRRVAKLSMMLMD
mgnify:CR=1 FL=1